MKMSGEQIFSEASSYLIANILSGTSRSDIADLSNYSKLPKFAWKTGTSYGKEMRGQLDSIQTTQLEYGWETLMELVLQTCPAAEAAVPLLFDLFNAIDYNSDVKWFEAPEELITREVCSESGLIPTPIL